MAESVQASVWIKKGFICCGKDYSGGSDGCAGGAWLHNTHTNSARCLISSACDDRCALGQARLLRRQSRYLANNVLRFEDRRKATLHHQEKCSRFGSHRFACGRPPSAPAANAR